MPPRTRSSPPGDGQGLWRFTSASDSDGHPLLHSLNGNQGRQVWMFDKDGGTPEERAQVEQARQDFTANRSTQKHSADELLRCAAASVLASACSG
jgi:hypothetical protein